MPIMINTNYLLILFTCNYFNVWFKSERQQWEKKILFDEELKVLKLK